MKIALLTMYVLTVLLISGFARADYALVQSAKYDQETHMLHVSGQFANACQNSPTLEVVRKVQAPEHTVAVLGVKVQGQGADVMCAQVINGQFDLVLDLRTLEIPRHRAVELRFLRSDVSPITAKIETDAFGLSKGNVDAIGTLVAIQDVSMNEGGPDYALVNGQNETIYVQSAVDLSDYLNKGVHLKGVSLDFETVPALDAVAVDIEFGKKPNVQNGRLVFATEISSAPLQ